MHKIVNRKGMPDIIFEAIKKNWYSGDKIKKDYSVTQLLKPVRITLLEKRHDEEIEVDAMGMIWSVFGSAIHLIMERGGEGLDNYELERRFTETIGNVLVSGQTDLYNKAEKGIEDYKVTSVWNYLFRNKVGSTTLHDWTMQLNIYRYFYIKYLKLPVDKLYINFIFRDWQASKAKFDINYPNNQVLRFNIELMDLDIVEQFILSRIKEFEDAKDLIDNDLPVCTKGQRWQDHDTFAVMKDGRKSAVKLFPYSIVQAKNFIRTHKDAAIMYVQERKGVPKKCMEYCDAAGHCNWYQQWKLDNAKE